MTKRFCICIGLTGALLVLAAALMIAQIDHQHALAAQHVRLVQAISDRDGCLTCHDAPAQTEAVRVIDATRSNLLLADLVRPANETYDITLAAAQHAPRDIDIRLRDIGYRLLDLPDVQAAQASDVIDRYLAVYDTVRADHAPYSVETLLSTLTEIEIALRTLEYEAHGVHWAAPDAPESQPDQVLALASVQGSAPSVAWTTAVTLEQTPSTQVALADEAAIRMTPALAYALLRRGPPADHVIGFTPFVAGRRLHGAL